MSPAEAPRSLVDGLAAGMAGLVLPLGRVAMGVIFVQSGFGKLANLSGFVAYLESGGVPAASVLAVIGAVGEFVGGLAVILGLQTRYAAVLMIAFMVVATAISHRFWELEDAAARGMQEINFLKNLALVGGFLLLFAAGPGRLSLDALLRRRG